jgi:CheY-like chemotaxis protein
VSIEVEATEIKQENNLDGEPHWTHNLSFKISDTGIGISPEHIGRLFTSFQQASASTTRKYGGTGLGLSISKQLVELQNGTISVESREGVGSVFTATIPYRVETNTQIVGSSKNGVQALSDRLMGLRILLVEDNEYNRIVAVDTLQLKIPSVVVEVACDGVEALEKLEQSEFDIILMDVHMPRMDGYDATITIRKSSKSYSSIPIIALTASVIGSDLDKCIQAGMNDYIPKPFRIDEMLKVISAHVSREHVVSDATQSFNTTPEPHLHQVIDLGFLTNFCEGNQERMRKYIDMYLTNSAVLQLSLADAIGAEDTESVRRLAHTLKSQFMYMGMHTAREAAKFIEENVASAGINESVRHSYDFLLNAMETAKILLSKEVNL